jgi:hypothetical protein
MPGYGLVSSDGYELVDQAGLVLDADCAPECCGGAVDCCRDPEGTRECGLRGTAPDGRTSRRHATVSEFETRSEVETFTSDVEHVVDAVMFSGALTTDDNACRLFTGNIRDCEGRCRDFTVTQSRRLISRVGSAIGDRLNGINCGTSVQPGTSNLACEVLWDVPIVREDRTTEEVEEDSFVLVSSTSAAPPCSYDVIRPPGQYNTARPAELCLPFTAACWKLGSGIARSLAEAPLFSPDPLVGRGHFPIPLGSSTTTETVPEPMPPGAIGVSTRTVSETIDSSLSWVATETEFRQEYRATRRLTRVIETDFRLAGSYTDEHGTVASTKRVRRTQRLVTTESHRRTVVMKLGWDLNCDLTPGPTVCSPVVTECEPDLIGYIIGERCGSPAGGSPATWVLPAANVTVCGVVQLGGECWRFDPVNGRRTNDPTALGANIGALIVTPESPRTCCECQPDSTCPKTVLDFDDYPEWLGGYRELPVDGQGEVGRFVFTRSYVAGKCCCFPGDRFRLLEQWSELETRSWPEDLLQSRERITIIPVARPPDIPFAPDIMGGGGFRRDEPRALFSIRVETFDAQGHPLHAPIDQHAIELLGPVGCPWRAFGTSGGTQVYGFDRPLHVDGLHPRNQGNLPTPLDTRFTNGVDEFTGWRIKRYAPGVICTLLTFDGEWERGGLPGDGVKFVVRSGARWMMTPAEPVSGPCAGGCVEVPAGPNAANPANGANAANERLGGGCGDCGGGDGRMR